jgi:hypothetical protein
VNELRFYDRGRELARAPQWRLRAHPNPWEVQLAFDNSPVTRWISFQKRFPGMYLEVDFGRRVQVDSVSVQSSQECATLPMEVQVQDDGGNWRHISGAPTRGLMEIPSGLRRAATLELKARGIRHVVVSDSDFAGPDMRKYTGYWGMVQVAEAHGIRLYRIE